MHKEYKTISVVVPVYNEQDSIGILFTEISNIEDGLPSKKIEVIFVDDGSSDESWDQIETLISNQDEGRVKGICLRRNFGKAVALNVGILEATGEIIFLMDADLQDDPAEMHKFIAAIEEGNDLVVGWKVDRQDPWHKTFPSKVFNYVTSKITGMPLHDFNCGFKCFRSEVFERITLYGEMHRFIPVLVDDHGYKVSEVPVNHRPRIHGKSKFGIERFLRGAIDLITVSFLTRYSRKPGHVFGSLALLTALIGISTLGYLLVVKLGGQSIGNRPLLLFGIMTTLASLQLASFGLLAELIIRKQMPRDEGRQLVKLWTGFPSDSDKLNDKSKH